MSNKCLAFDLGITQFQLRCRPNFEIISERRSAYWQCVKIKQLFLCNNLSVMLRKLEWPFYLLSFYSFLEINVFCSTLYFIPWAMTPIFWGGVICFAPGEKSRPPLFFLQGNRKQKRKCLLLPKGESAETQSSTSSLQHFFTFIHETFRCCNAVTVMSRVLRGLVKFSNRILHTCVFEV